MIARNTFQRLPEIKGETEHDTADLAEMAKAATSFLRSFKWCPPIATAYLAFSVPGVVALFLFEFRRKIQKTDDKLWVVVGDIPSAYMVVEPDDSPADALGRYCSLMDEWVFAVRDGRPLDAVYPVNAMPTLENSQQLESRLAFVRSEVIPLAGMK